MLYALCTNRQCAFTVELQDAMTGRSIETPKACPVCRSEVISVCPSCGFPLVGAPGSPTCPVCAANMKPFSK